MKNMIIDGHYVENVHVHDRSGKHHAITAVYRGAKKIWELIVGFIFTRDGYSLNTKDGYIIKCKDQ